MKKPIIAAFSAAAIMLTSTGCYFFPEEEELLDAPTVKVEDVTYSTYIAKTEDLVSKSVLSGYVSSKTQQDCFFTDYTGQLKTIYVKAGDMVEEGDVIAEMNVGTLSYDLATQKLVVQQAQLKYNSNASQDNLLQLQIEQNTLEKYQAQYDGSKIYAPCSGQVSYVKLTSAGTDVKPYEVLATIIDPDEIYINCSTSNGGDDFKKGQSVTAVIDDKEYEATVEKTPAELEEEGAEETAAIWVDLDGDGPSFASMGDLADVTLIKDEVKDAVVIPKKVVQTLDGRTYVQVLKDGKKVDVDVETGISNATEIQIKSGISAGDEVIVR